MTRTDGSISGDKNKLTLQFNKFYTLAGTGIPISQSRKNCQTSLGVRWADPPFPYIPPRTLNTFIVFQMVGHSLSTPLATWVLHSQSFYEQHRPTSNRKDIIVWIPAYQLPIRPTTTSLANSNSQLAVKPLPVHQAVGIAEGRFLSSPQSLFIKPRLVYSFQWWVWTNKLVRLRRGCYRRHKHLCPSPEDERKLGSLFRHPYRSRLRWVLV